MIDIRKHLNEDHCYIKTMIVYERPVYAVFNNEGFIISSFEKREIAFATAQTHDLIPHSLH